MNGPEEHVASTLIYKCPIVKSKINSDQNGGAGAEEVRDEAGGRAPEV